MWKNRTGYIAMLVMTNGLFFHFGRPFLLGMLIFLLVLPVVLLILLKTDARKIQLEFQIRSGARAEKEVPTELQIHANGRLYASGGILVEMKIHNLMFDTQEQKNLFLEPIEGGEHYPFQMSIPLCGEVSMECGRIRLYDLLKLFHVEIQPFQQKRTVVYPEQVSLQVELETQTKGAFSEEGLTQNRKGNDPSEMYDIREYLPGDDVRAIHWKLSSKTDGLILRQPGAAMHYQIALMPDFSKEENDVITDAEWNRAIAVLIATGEHLLKTGVPFCMLIPEQEMLTVTEIRSRRTFKETLSRWMGSQVQKTEAEGYQRFQMAHMELYFTRLLIVTAGKRQSEIKSQSGQIIVVCMMVTEGCEKLQIEKWQNNMLVEIPAAKEKKGTWNIIC